MFCADKRKKNWWKIQASSSRFLFLSSSIKGRLFAARLSRELHSRDGTRMHSPVQRVVTTCGFPFILRVEKDKSQYHMVLEEVYTRGEVFAGRKLSSMTVRIMFPVPRTHRDEHGRLCKSRARDEGTCPSFLS